MVAVELARPLRTSDTRSQELTGKPAFEGVDLSAIFTGNNAKLLQGKTPEQISFLQFVVSVRIRVRDGEMTLEKSPKNPNGKEMTQMLKKELGVIHKTIPIINMDLPISNSALAVHGEVGVGEAINLEGTLDEIEI